LLPSPSWRFRSSPSTRHCGRTGIAQVCASPAATRWPAGTAVVDVEQGSTRASPSWDRSGPPRPTSAPRRS
jgi:hypothetical protein